MPVVFVVAVVLIVVATALLAVRDAEQASMRGFILVQASLMLAMVIYLALTS